MSYFPSSQYSNERPQGHSTWSQSGSMPPPGLRGSAFSDRGDRGPSNNYFSPSPSQYTAQIGEGGRERPSSRWDHPAGYAADSGFRSSSAGMSSGGAGAAGAYQGNAGFGLSRVAGRGALNEDFSGARSTSQQRQQHPPLCWFEFRR